MTDDPGPMGAASPAVVTWKDYADTTTRSLHGNLAALGRQVEAGLADLRRADDHGAHAAERAVVDLKDYVNRVFSEHERAVNLTQAQTARQVQELSETRAGLEYVNALFNEHRIAIDGTAQANLRAIDLATAQVEQRVAGREAAIDQRFSDSQRAVETALVQVGTAQAAQQRAVEVALVQVEQRIAAVAALSAERVDGVRREAVAALAASEKAIVKSEATYEKRFEAVNEFRAQLSDQTATFMPREVAEALIAEVRRSADSAAAELRAHVTSLQQRLDMASGVLSAAPTTATQIAQLASKVENLGTRQDMQTGAAAGSTRSIGYMVTAVGILLTIIIFVANYLTQRGG